MTIRILVVDDSVVVRKLLTQTLSEVPGMEVVATAALGKIALSKIQQVSPDIVILDVEMPEMDGIETLKHIRKLAPRLPVIMFSTKTERGAAATIEALTCGASDYVPKPSNVGNVMLAMTRVREEMVPKIQALTAGGRGAASGTPGTPGSAPSNLPAAAMAPLVPTSGPMPARAVTAAIPRAGSGPMARPLSPGASARPISAMASLVPGAPGAAGAPGAPGAPARTTTAIAPLGAAAAPGPSESRSSRAIPALNDARATAAITANTPTAAMAVSSAHAPTPATAPRNRIGAAPPLMNEGPIRLAPPSGPRPPVEIIAIGASTGGPNALAVLLPELPAEFPVPIVIVQHMLATFTRHFAERLAAQCRIKIVEATEGAPLLPGHVYIARGDYHLLAERRGGLARLAMNQDLAENFCRPAVDVLFRSVAHTYGASALAVILTGMGHDGLLGCSAIRDAGGDVIVQDEQSSVVWGMPGFVARAGLASMVLPLDQLGFEVRRRVSTAAVLGAAT